MTYDINHLESALRDLKWIDDAAVCLEKEDGSANQSMVAYVVPNEIYAGVLNRGCQLIESDELNKLSLYSPAPHISVAQINRRETDFLWTEIFEDQQYFRNGIRLPESPVIVDVGANIGMFALLASHFRPKSKIFCAEPLPDLAKAITANGFLYQFDVTVLNVALGAKEGEINFTFYPNNTVMSGRFASYDGDRELVRSYMSGQGDDANDLSSVIDDRLKAIDLRCPITTLSQLVQGQGIEHIDLLKVDVERSEQEVLDGINDATWDIVSQIVLEVHELPGRVEAIVSMLEGKGYRVTVERDQRLSATECLNVYAYRDTDIRPNEPETFDWSTVSDVRSMSALVTEIERCLEQSLPNEALPARYVCVRTLADIASYQGVTEHPLTLTKRSLEPSTPTEIKLAKLYREVLRVKDVYSDTDFFKAGGNSLSAIRLITKAEAAFGSPVLAPDTLFTTGVLRNLAVEIDQILVGV